VRLALDSLRVGDELLVGAADPEDTGLKIVRSALGDDPRVLFVEAPPGHAGNRKVLALDAMFHRAQHGILVLADSDIRLEREALERLVAPLTASPEVGLATALYRVAAGSSWGRRLEAATIHTEFVCNVLAARALAGAAGLRFALGAANAVRRECVLEMGGFIALSEHLADDYELGRRVALQGRRVELAPCTVEILHTGGLCETLSRLLRWSRTYRVCRPWGYLGTAFTHHGLAAGLALLLVALPRGWHALRLGGALAAWLAARLAAAAAAHRLLRTPLDPCTVLLLPVRDLLGTALFALAWVGRDVTWRGRRFRILPDGRLQAMRPASSA
jgi:ceramide glucosyltransferase